MKETQLWVWRKSIVGAKPMAVELASVADIVVETAPGKPKGKQKKA